MSTIAELGMNALATGLERGWMAKEPTVFHNLYHPTATIEGLMPDVVVSVTDMVEIVSQYNEMVDITGYEIHKCFDDGSCNHFACLTMHAELLATGKKASFKVMNLLRFENDALMHIHFLSDGVAFMEGIGALPKEAMFVALAGGDFS